jgi:hypothetical protein
VALSPRDGIRHRVRRQRKVSNAALIGGPEWRVKFTQTAQVDLYVVAQAQFKSLWNDPHFANVTALEAGSRAADGALPGLKRVKVGTLSNYSRLKRLR